MWAVICATILASAIQTTPIQPSPQVRLEAKSGLCVTSSYSDMWDLCNKVYSEYPYLYTAEGKSYIYKQGLFIKIT